MTRPSVPLGRCLSGGEELTVYDWMYAGDSRFCIDCDADQVGYAVVDAWAAMAEAMNGKAK